MASGTKTKLVADSSVTGSSSANKPFDALARDNIGTLLAIEFVEQPMHPLPPTQRFAGAGVYALYYSGADPRYAPLLKLNQKKLIYPIYVGDALRKNAKQGFSATSTQEGRIFGRLQQHAKSINQTKLNLGDFSCRYLVLEDAFIALAESVLISVFRPAWNGRGFGSRAVGAPRLKGKASDWDALHSGRGDRPQAGSDAMVAAEHRLANFFSTFSARAFDPIERRMHDRVLKFV